MTVGLALFLLPPAYADRRFLPLARLDLMIRRPAFVDIRFLKPWALFRFKLLGWNVRFMFIVVQSVTLLKKGGYLNVGGFYLSI